MLGSSTNVDCGDISVEFFNDDASKSALDTDLFLDNRNVVPHQFTVIQTSDLAKIGTYPIKFRAYFTDYSAN